MTWQLLLVEDEASVREAFALRLTGQGYAVQTAGSGEECLTILKSFEPDILILDLVMCSSTIQGSRWHERKENHETFRRSPHRSRRSGLWIGFEPG